MSQAEIENLYRYNEPIFVALGWTEKTRLLFHNIMCLGQELENYDEHLCRTMKRLILGERRVAEKATDSRCVSDINWNTGIV